MSVYGLYQPYKINRPLNRSEKNYRLLQGQPKKVKFFNCEQSVIKMNSTYMETVDKFYKEGGTNTQFFALLFFIFSLIYLYSISYVIFFSSKEVKDVFIDIAMISGVISFFLIYTGRCLLKEWFKWTHYPIRFNRKNKMVYVFRTDGTVLTAPWNDIYFCQDKEPGPLREWSIRGHILDKDGETVCETFSLGICENKESMPEYWEFIRCYMEEDVVAELSQLVVFCPPIEDRREGYIFGLQRLICMDSRLMWFFFPFMLPLNLVASVCRYITSQTGKIPRWPQEVLDACQPEVDDPVNISATNNPKYMWQLVFANQPHEIWKEKYDRMEKATSYIHKIIADKYRD